LSGGKKIFIDEQQRITALRSSTQGRYVQLDIVLATRVGVVVFEVKELIGWIFGSGQQEWTQVLAYGRQWYRFYNPDGFNVGINIHTAVGHTVPHAHIHLIPRYQGDVQELRGGVRGGIPT